MDNLSFDVMIAIGIYIVPKLMEAKSNPNEYDRRASAITTQFDKSRMQELAKRMKTSSNIDGTNRSGTGKKSFLDGLSAYSINECGMYTSNGPEISSEMEPISDRPPSSHVLSEHFVEGEETSEALKSPEDTSRTSDDANTQDTSPVSSGSEAVRNARDIKREIENRFKSNRGTS